ncbi:MAG: 1-phosphofructokinase family hexose kinase [Chloroflexota bacterium]
MTALVCVAPNPAIDRIYEVDRLTPGAIHRPVRATAVPGGKGLNVARAAHHLGADVVAVTILRGHAGRWVDEALASAGVTVRAVWTSGETRTCVSVRDPATPGLTEVYDRGEAVPADAWRDLESLVRVESTAAALVTVSGGVPPGVDDGAFARICGVAAEAGARILLDVYGVALARALGEGPWLVKVNEAEAGDLLERHVSGVDAARDAAAELVARGAGAAIVTRGTAGAVAAAAGDAWLVGPPAAEGPYPVGSGDAFLAGLATGLLEGEDLVGALRLGAGAAAANALVPGQGEFDPAVARDLAGRIGVTRA